MSEDEMLKLRALRAFFYASVTLGEHLPLIPYLRDRGIVFTMVCEKMVQEGLKHPIFKSIVEWLIDSSNNEWHDTEVDLASYVSVPKNQDTLLNDNMFVKLNFGFLALIYIDSEQYEAYYEVLKDVILNLDPQVNEVVLDELIHFCQERNYLVKCLQGVENKTQLTLHVSDETFKALKLANFVEENENSCKEVSIEINQNTAEFCKNFVKDHTDMNHMEFSQMLQLQPGRYQMKTKKYFDLHS
jgi:predicted transport protein